MTMAAQGNSFRSFFNDNLPTDTPALFGSRALVSNRQGYQSKAPDPDDVDQFHRNRPGPGVLLMPPPHYPPCTGIGQNQVIQGSLDGRCCYWL